MPSLQALTASVSSRQLLAIPRGTFSALAVSATRSLSTAPALPFPLEDEQPALDFQILDIFDAPSRLGESSKLLALAASARALPVRPARALSTRTRTPTVPTLPLPIVFDGPARPRHITFAAYRAGRADRVRAASSIRSPFPPPTLPPPPPTPEVFDGPSKLRPYGRGSARDSSTWNTSPTSLLILAISGVAIVYGWNEAQPGTPVSRRRGETE